MFIGRTPRKLYLYEVDQLNYKVPYGFKDTLIAFLDEKGIKYKVEQETTYNPIKIVDKVSTNLYDYQLEAVEEMMKHENGILVSPAGSGKTRMAMELIKRKGLKTLWLTNNLSLLTQSKKVAKEFIGNSLGEISGGKVNIQDITFATVQTMANLDLTQYRDTFGLVLTDECFTGDVEILTNKGYIRFDELKDEKVAQYHENGTINFVEPTRKIKNYREEKIVKIHTRRGRHITMTQNHNQVILNSKNEIEKVKAKDINRGILIRAGKGTGNDIHLTPYERLLIVTQADGYKTQSGQNQYQIALKKTNKIEMFLDIASKLDIDISLKEVKARKGYRRFTYYLPQGVNGKRLWENFKLEDFSYNKAKQFINEVLKWDGYKNPKYENFLYDSTIKENTDFVSAIATLAGYANHQVKKEDKRSEKFNDIHRVFMSGKSQLSKTPQSIKKELIDYKGYVYCVEVPTNMIIVRSQGVSLISGNCHRVGGTPTKMAQFYKVLSNLNVKAKFGLTATLYAKENDISIVPNYMIGNTRHTIKKEDVPRVTAEHLLIECNTEPSHSYLKPDKTIDFNKLLEHLIQDETRNETIIRNLLLNINEHNIIITSRNEHINIINEMLNSYGIETRVVTGETKKAIREEYYNDFREGRVNFILSNYPLAKEGLDLPIANVIHLLLPVSDKATIIQTAGRVERTFEGKTNSYVYDYVDINFGTLINMYKTRRRHLNAR